METLGNFFRKLAQREGAPALNPVPPWNPPTVTFITNAFKHCWQQARIEFSVERDLHGAAKSSNEQVERGRAR